MSADQEIENSDSDMGPRLRAARVRRGWSREALAFHSGLSWSAIAQLESGRRRNARPQTLAALAEALGVTIDYLVHGSPPSSVMLEHRVLLYGTEAEFVETVGPFLDEGIERGEALLVVTTIPRIELLRKRLGADAVRVEFIDRESWYTDPAPALRDLAGWVKDKLDAGASWVRYVGDPDWTGHSETQSAVWTRYESLVNLVFANSPASLLCTYDTRTIAPEVSRHACLTHPHTIGADGVAVSADYADPGGFVLGT
jgi:transcriptional regulator with XRE-family HTH domain